MYIHVHVHDCLWATEYINFTTIYHNPSKRQTKNLLFMELDELFLDILHGKRLPFKIDLCYFMINLFHDAMLTK